MAALPVTTNFRIENYAEAEEWFLRFLDELNTSYGQLTGALDGNLSRGANIAGTIHAPMRAAVGAALTADASPFPLYLTANPRARPRAVWVGRVTPVDGAALPSSAVMPLWDFTGDGRIRIRLVTGLPINSTYDITFLSE